MNKLAISFVILLLACRGIKMSTHLRNHFQELLKLQATVPLLILLKQVEYVFEELNITWQDYPSTYLEPKFLPGFVKKSHQYRIFEESSRNQEPGSIPSNINRKEAGGSRGRFTVEGYGLPKLHHLLELDGLPDCFGSFACAGCHGELGKDRRRWFVIQVV